MNPRIKQLPQTVSIGASMIMPIYDYESDTTYFVTIGNLLPTNSSGTTNARWNNTATFASGQLAEYGGVIWESQIDNNIGNIPFNGSAFWTQVSVVTGMLLPWQAGAYTNNSALVTYTNGGITNIYQLNVAAPFNSTNFETELSAGKWTLVGQSLVISNVAENALNFLGADNIFQLGSLAADTTITFVNAVSGRFELLFTVTASLKLTVPANCLSNDARWETDSAKTFTILNLGDYSLRGSFNSNSNNWTLTLN